MTNENGSDHDQEYPVQLFVYDLSRGMARQLSMPLTGRQIDGIWHTSIVAWDREYFFGQGISVVHPGTSHHGAPLETHNLGTTSIDLETFEGALLPDLQQRFRAQDYNLFSWNCNNFTQEVSQMLTGNEIPAHIRSLPQDFLSTPFGQMLRPQIDAMFGSPVANIPSAALAAPNGFPVNGNNLLDQVASRAYAGNTPVEPSAKPSSADPIRHITSQSQLDELLRIFPCVAVLFTSETCPPCRVLKPVFHDLAHKHYVDETKPGNHKRIAFVQVDSGPASVNLFQSLNVAATPTVKCFTLGKQFTEMKGADTSELKTSIDLILFEVYPPHPHTQIPKPLQSIRKIPSQPHTFNALPNLRTALQKLDSLVAEHPAKSFADKADLQDARRILASSLVPWLEKANGGRLTQPPPTTLAAELNKAAIIFERLLPVTVLFPVMDMIRIAALNERFVEQSFFGKLEVSDRKEINALSRLLSKVSALAYDQQWETSRKAIYLTTARMLANLTATETLKDSIEAHEHLRSLVLELMTTLLLCPDAGVRSAAATCAFNLALHQHKERADWINKDPQAPPMLGSRLGETWESEVTSALLQAIVNETESDETLHRLLAGILLHVHMSQFWSDSIAPMLEVLEAKEALQAKKKHELVTKSSKADDLAKIIDDLLVLVSSVSS